MIAKVLSGVRKIKNSFIDNENTASEIVYT